MSKTANKLRKARGYIEQGWCQGAFARNRLGDVVNNNSRSAVAWCADGACRRARVDGALIEAVLRPRTALWLWNDRRKRTQAEVLAAFDRAIALAEQEAQ